MKSCRQVIQLAKYGLCTGEVLQSLDVGCDLGEGCKVDVLLEHILDHEEGVAHHEVCCNREGSDKVFAGPLLGQLFFQNLHGHVRELTCDVSMMT